MPRLICRGSKTKLDVYWDGPRTTTRLTALGNGAELGEFPTAAAAKSHAEALLPDDRAVMYLVLNEDETIAHWVYDLDEQRRLDRRSGLRNALLTACILALITAAALALSGVPLSSTMGRLLLAGSIGWYLVMRTFQNSIEALVAWFIIFVLIMTVPFFPH